MHKLQNVREIAHRGVTRLQAYFHLTAIKVYGLNNQIFTPPHDDASDTVGLNALIRLLWIDGREQRLQRRRHRMVVSD